MQAWFDNFALHDIGTVTLVEESSNFEPADQPQKETLQLRLRIDVWRPAFDENRAALQEIQTKLRAATIGRLKLQQDDLTLHDQDATLVADGFPPDINEWGAYRGQLQLVFRLVKNTLGADSLQATFTPDGGASFSLGMLFAWKETLRSERFDNMRDHRKEVIGRISAKGEFPADMTQTLNTRRASLVTLKEQWLAQLRRKSGTLVFGSAFNRVVMIDEMSAEVDSASEKIVWSMDASYTRFPNEDGYAGVDYEVGTRTGEDGESFLSLNGRILAESEARGLATLVTIEAATLTAQGFSATKQTRREVKSRTVGTSSFDGAIDDGDGTTFLELTFSIEYRKVTPDHLSWTLSTETQDDVTAGVMLITYSGTVTAGFQAATTPSGMSETDAAFWVAVNKAKELGENKHELRERATIRREERSPTKTAEMETVTVSFSFGYKTRGQRIFAEVRSETTRATFGEDAESVSGFVAGASEGAITAYYAVIKAAYAEMLRNEVTTWQDIRMAAGTYPALSTASVSADNQFKFTATPATYNNLKHRMDFSFQVFRPKPSSHSIKYRLRVNKDLQSLIQTTTVEGSLYGSATICNDAYSEAASNVLTAFIAGLALGNCTARQRDLDREYVSTGSSPGNTLKLDFAETYEAKIAGDATIIECSVTEKIRFSGTRQIVVPIPDSTVQVQQLGTVEARRVITGYVRAATETVALGWVKRQKALAFGVQSVGTGLPVAPTVYFDEPAEIEIVNQFAKRVDGDARGTDTARTPTMITVNFTFAQIIPYYPYQIS